MNAYDATWATLFTNEHLEGPVLHGPLKSFSTGKEPELPWPTIVPFAKLIDKSVRILLAKDSCIKIGVGQEQGMESEWGWLPTRYLISRCKVAEAPCKTLSKRCQPNSNCSFCYLLALSTRLPPKRIMLFAIKFSVVIYFWVCIFCVSCMRFL